MERTSGGFPLLLLFGCSLLLVCGPGGADGYQNYTVGDDLGWYDKLEVADVDYQSWASGKNFTLGDFLLFNTNTNHSVVQTYNHTTYKRCSLDDAQDDDTLDWTSTPPGVVEISPVTLSVPLVKEGPNYFFSGYYDGEQCKNGQRLEITVLHGKGLPESLRAPAAADSPESPNDDDDDEAAPDTTVPADFSHPKNVGTVEETSAGGGRAGLGWLGVVVVFVVWLASSHGGVRVMQ